MFQRGWHRLKLYFMIGLPTEQDEDVGGIVDTGQRMLRIGRRHMGKKAEVTVSVSSHVPKPHTPFQWCAQDSLSEIQRKQRILRGKVTERGLRLKYHDAGISFVEGMRLLSGMPRLMRYFASQFHTPTSQATYRNRKAESSQSAGRPSTEPTSDALNPRSPVGGGIGVMVCTTNTIVVRTAAA